MGGDHKCPVCLATFTRPQHVARHMRSHTGDRPYKCQHCGDQFARSDLLSRHVKKCHANEPRIRSNSNYRRKGTASASRATTSKQACDQCVQSLLPCDGANPCAKCAQRGCQCTFVKFHRQTAPVGPGHNTRPSDASYTQSASSSLTSDGFLLAPAPSSLSLNDPVFSSFLPQSMYTNGQGPSLSLAEPDYRARPDLTKGGSIAQPFLDLTTSPTTSSWQSQHQQQNSSASDAINRQYPTSYPVGQAGDYYREASTDLGGDVGSSIPSSASSSSVHLPIPQDVVMQPPEQHYANPSFQGDSHRSHSQAQGEGGFSSAFGLMSLDDPAVASGQATDAQPFFWNTLDLIYGSTPQSSIPSAKNSYGSRPPLVQRPSTSSGVPYSGSFPSASSPSSNRTPSATREAETRELREFWKAYLRTPLSGPFMSTPRGEDHQLGAEGRSSQYPNNNGYKRQRVSSLPSVRTPGPSEVNENPDNGGETSSMRTTLHGNADDLRSYEAAVLARKAPLNLHIVPRRKQSRPQRNQTHSTRGVGASQTPLQLKMPQQVWNGKRPGSSASVTSSLAHALGDASSPSPSVSSTSDYSREGSLGLY